MAFSLLLRTPLVSLTNAVASIAVVGLVVVTGKQHDTFSVVLDTVAVACSMINATAGFLITERILKMFKKREP